MIVKQLKKELTKLNAKRTKLSKFLAKQNKKPYQLRNVSF